MRTYYVYVNITLSVDEKSVERAREVARQQGKSLNAMIRDYIEHLAGESTGDEVAGELQRIWDELDKDRSSTGIGKLSRDDLYEDRIGRYGRRG